MAFNLLSSVYYESPSASATPCSRTSCASVTWCLVWDLYEVDAIFCAGAYWEDESRDNLLSLPG